eukprot:1161443-Pelagomonas_calceolata.AAC.2
MLAPLGLILSNSRMIPDTHEPVSLPNTQAAAKRCSSVLKKQLLLGPGPLVTANNMHAIKKGEAASFISQKVTLQGKG